MMAGLRPAVGRHDGSPLRLGSRAGPPGLVATRGRGRRVIRGRGGLKRFDARDLLTLFVSEPPRRGYSAIGPHFDGTLVNLARAQDAIEPVMHRCSGYADGLGAFGVVQFVRFQKLDQGRGASGFGLLHMFRLANRYQSVKVNPGVEVN